MDEGTRIRRRRPEGLLAAAVAATLVASLLGAFAAEPAGAATVPGTPTAVNSVASSGSATVSWSAPVATGGKVITGYSVTPYVGFFPMPTRIFASKATTQVVTGMTNGWTYRFKVAAINSVGTGPQSIVSNPVVPAPVVTPPSPTEFVHPGVLVSGADLDFVRAQIAAGREPWKSALDSTLGSYSSESTALRPTRYRYSSLSYQPAAVAAVQEGGDSAAAYIAAHPELGLKQVGGTEHIDDAIAAYTHALLWYYTGNSAYAKKSIEIMNAWSSTLKEIKFDTPVRVDNGERVFGNGKLQAGWGGSLFARAAEIIRYTGGGWNTGDVAKFETLLRNVYLPLTVSGWSNTPNWMMTLTEATVGIGVFLNDRATFDAGVAEWRAKAPTTIYMASDGSLPKAPASWYDTTAEMNELWYYPSSYVTGLQGETLRDISHMALGLGAMSNTAQTARIQGVDLFKEQQARIIAGYERSADYVNQYLDQVAALGGAEPASTWRPTGWVGATFTVGGLGYKGGWEVAYSHYAIDLGVDMPSTARLVARLRPSQPLLNTTWETLTSAQ